MRHPAFASLTSNRNKLNDAIDLAMRKKPEKHEFSIKSRSELPKIERHMSVTGG